MAVSGISVKKWHLLQIHSVFASGKTACRQGLIKNKSEEGVGTLWGQVLYGGVDKCNLQQKYQESAI